MKQYLSQRMILLTVDQCCGINQIELTFLMALTKHLERLDGQADRPAICSLSATKKRIAKAISIELWPGLYTKNQKTLN